MNGGLDADPEGVNLPSSSHADLKLAVTVAAFVVYAGIVAALCQNEMRLCDTGTALAQKQQAIEARLVGVSSYLDRLEKTAGPPPVLAGLREEQTEVLEERRESTREYNTWKEQRSAWTIKRWFVLTLATLAFFPVALWGFQSWSIWARDKRLNPPHDR
jgi:hypothetical protein